MAHAPVLWAQRKDKLFVTIDLPDITEETIQLTEDKLSVTGKSGDAKKEFAVEMEFFKPIKTDNVKQSVFGCAAKFVIWKKEREEEHWPRILKVKGKHHWLKVDWNKWVDEDEEEDEENEFWKDWKDKDFGNVDAGQEAPGA